jgi:uncharacterized protein YegL
MAQGAISEHPADVIPVYFVPDESGSMADVTSDMDQGLTATIDALHKEPGAAAMVRFSVIGFSEDIYEHLRLANLAHLTRSEQIPRFKAYYETWYVNIFKDLRSRIEEDFKRLRQDGFHVRRPIIFFLTDGNPNPASQPWRQALSELTQEGFKYHPHILAFGLGHVTPEVISEVATNPKYAYLVAKGTDTGAAIASFFKELSRSVIATTQTLHTNNPQIDIRPPDGFQPLDLDLLPGQDD